MPIFMMVPEMVSTSLVTSKMYQPLTNSSRSHRLTTRPRFRLMNLTNSCGGRLQGGGGRRVVRSWVQVIPELGEDRGVSHVLQQEASEQRAGTQQEGEGAGEDNDDIKQEPEAVVSCGEGAPGKAR